MELIFRVQDLVPVRGLCVAPRRPQLSTAAGSTHRPQAQPVLHPGQDHPWADLDLCSHGSCHCCTSRSGWTTSSIQCAVCNMNCKCSVHPVTGKNIKQISSVPLRCMQWEMQYDNRDKITVTELTRLSNKKQYIEFSSQKTQSYLFKKTGLDPWNSLFQNVLQTSSHVTQKGQTISEGCWKWQWHT